MFHFDIYSQYEVWKKLITGGIHRENINLSPCRAAGNVKTRPYGYFSQKSLILSCVCGVGGGWWVANRSLLTRFNITYAKGVPETKRSGPTTEFRNEKSLFYLMTWKSSSIYKYTVLKSENLREENTPRKMFLSLIMTKVAQHVTDSS